MLTDKCWRDIKWNEDREMTTSFGNRVIKDLRRQRGGGAGYHAVGVGGTGMRKRWEMRGWREHLDSIHKQYFQKVGINSQGFARSKNSI